jgi:probable F420-dependent oxidoreductase
VEFWVIAPLFGTDVSARLLRDFAVSADELGFDAIVVPDRTLAEGGADPALFGAVLESTVALSYISSLTTRVRLGTSVLVAPVRNAVVLAKQIATLDVLSEGRAFVGLGSGWSESEFRNVGVDFKRRGLYTDETIQIMRHLFSGSSETFTGKFHSLSDYLFAPLPIQGADLPIVVGGTSDAALRRAALLGDMWQSPRTEIDVFADRAAKVRSWQGSRSVKLGVEIRKGSHWGTPIGSQSAGALHDEVQSWIDAGSECITLGVRPVSEFLPYMELYAAAVLPAFTGPRPRATPSTG